jgi:hypothetical protein
MNIYNYNTSVLEDFKDFKYNDKINFYCSGCNNIFPRIVKRVRQDIINKQKNIFCSKGCLAKYQTKKISVNCAYCDKLFDKKLFEFKKTQNHFCCRSCNISFQNKESSKRQVEGLCLKCNCSIPSRLKYCKNCKSLNESRPIKDYFDADGRKASKYVKIRQRARKQYLAYNTSDCVMCGYTHHIEVAHIQDIASFDPNTPLNIVNDPSNLAGLCRNCHWELDHGILLKKQIIEKLKT